MAELDLPTKYPVFCNNKTETEQQVKLAEVWSRCVLRNTNIVKTEGYPVRALLAQGMS